MTPIRFKSLPFIVQLTSIMTIFMAWVMIEEWIIDRHGLDRFLPYYQVGNLCLYDAAVALILLALWRPVVTATHR